MRRLTLTILLSLLAGCSTPALDPIDPPKPLQAFDATLHTDIVWSHELSPGVFQYHLRLGPLVDGERVYLAASNGRVVSLEDRDGAKVWQRDLDRNISSGPVDAGKLLLLGSENAVLALDKSSGELVWQRSLGSEVLAPPVVEGQKVIARSIDGKVYALQHSDGRVLWQYEQPTPSLTLRGLSTPLIVDDKVIVGFANGKLVSLNLSDGSQAWELEVAPPRGRTELERLVDIDASPVSDGSLVYVASFQDKIAAVSLISGRLIWSREIGTARDLALVDGTLYLTDRHGNLWALSSRSGASLWKQDALRGRSPSGVVTQGNYLIVGDYSGYLHWFAREDGRQVARTRVEDWHYRFPVKDELYSEDTVSDRAVFALPVAVGRRVYAVDKRGVLNTYDVTSLDNRAEQ